MELLPITCPYKNKQQTGFIVGVKALENEHTHTQGYAPIPANFFVIRIGPHDRAEASTVLSVMPSCFIQALWTKHVFV